MHGCLQFRSSSQQNAGVLSPISFRRKGGYTGGDLCKNLHKSRILHNMLLFIPLPLAMLILTIVNTLNSCIRRQHSYCTWLRLVQYLNFSFILQRARAFIGRVRVEGDQNTPEGELTEGSRSVMYYPSHKSHGGYSTKLCTVILYPLRLF